MSGPGRVKHFGRSEFVIGNLPGQRRSRDELERLAEVFKRAAIGCTVSDNLEGELWMKLILNCAYNAISALGRSNYGLWPPTRWCARPCARSPRRWWPSPPPLEFACPPVDPIEFTFRLADSMPGQMSSTAHDIARGRPTEIDSLNGYLVRRGRELGVPVPVNQTLYALVKLREQNASE